MPAKTSLNVSLTPELEQFIQTRVASGRYQTASEVVREGLRLLEAREQEHEITLITLKEKLAHSAAQADRGEFVDPTDVLKRIEDRRHARTIGKAV